MCCCWTTVAIPELLNNLDGGELVCLSKLPIIAIQGVPRQREQDQYQLKQPLFSFLPCTNLVSKRKPPGSEISVFTGT